MTLRVPWWPVRVVGGLVTVASCTWLARALYMTSARREQERATNALYTVVGSLPEGMVAADPTSGKTFGVQRPQGRLTLWVMDTDDLERFDADPATRAVITCYSLRHWAGPAKPYPAVLRFDRPVGAGWEPDAADAPDNYMVELHEQTGVLYTTTEDVSEVVDQLGRALDHLVPDRYTGR